MVEIFSDSSLSRVDWGLRLLDLTGGTVSPGALS